MPRRAPITTRDYLKKVPLPQHATTYTVIEHETVIVNTLDQLKLKGFTVEQEHYRSNNSGEVAIGVYHLTYKSDPELGMMFAWANSYDKSMRFKCAVGGFIKTSKSSMIGDDFSWSRKHTGTADQEMVAQVTNQVINAQMYYDNLLLIRDQMKKLIVTSNQVAEFLGRVFFVKGLFTKEQIGIVRDEMMKPSFSYSSGSDTLWAHYNHMLIALKRAHPRTWMDEQLALHKTVCAEFMLTTTTVTTTAPVVVKAVQVPGPVNVFVEQGDDTPQEKMNMEEFAEVKQDLEIANSNEEVEILTTEPELTSTNSIPFLGDDVTDEEQRLIDERMAQLTGSKKEDSVDLNLPD